LQTGRHMLITRSRIPLLLLVLVCAACNKKVTASNDFKAAMNEFRPALKAFTTDFPKHELALQQLRKTDPAGAARKIETEVVPLLDQLARALDKAHTSGLAYVELATDEDPAVVQKIRHNVEQIGKQQQGAARVRDLYAAQARQLGKGPLSADDELQFAKATSQAFMLIGG